MKILLARLLGLTVRQELACVFEVGDGFVPFRHVPNLQGLVTDQVMVANQGQGGLVSVVEALSPDRPVQGGNPVDGFLAPVGPALLSREVLLRGSQLGC